MENDKYISRADSYIHIGGDAKEVTQFIDAFQDGEVKLFLSTKSLPKHP